MKEEIKYTGISLIVAALLIILFIVTPALIFDRVSCYIGLENMDRDGHWEFPGICIVKVNEKYYPSSMLRKNINDTVNIND